MFASGLLLVLLISLAGLLVESTERQTAGSGEEFKVRAVLLGWMGHGKTFFCNMFDGTFCGAHRDASTANPEDPMTMEPYFGKEFIDTAGFGDNAVIDDGGLHASLRVINQTLTAMNNSDIRALVWIVPCFEFATPTESFDNMKIVSKAVGYSVPIHAIFNPGADNVKCRKDSLLFTSKANQHGVSLTGVTEFSAFDIRAFKAKHPDSYRVILPSRNVLDAMLSAHDPQKLASDLESYRQLECTKLPDRLQRFREDIETSMMRIRNESSIPLCDGSDATCPHISSPDLKSCLREVCIAKEPNCRNSCSFWRCKWKCEGERCTKMDHVEDQACMTSNTLLVERHQSEMEACKNDGLEKLQKCEVSRAIEVVHLQNENKEHRNRTNELRSQELSTLAAMRSCETLVHSRASWDKVEKSLLTCFVTYKY